MHETNKGAGAAISTGYLKALEDGMDIVATMDGDNQMDPAHALRPPDFDPNRIGTYLCLGVKGYVELEFTNNVAIDGPGPDIKVYGDPGNDDSWHVDVSEDGDNWVHFGPQPEVVELDLAEVGLSRVRFIRFTDTGTGNNGAELDAVEALNWEPAG